MSISLNDYLKNFAKERNGTFKVKKTAPGIGGMNSWRVTILNLPYKNGEIHFIISQASSMKIHYIFNLNIKLDFLIYNEDWTDKIGKLLGLKEHQIGINKFDNKFIIKGTNKTFVSNILDKPIREFLIKNDRFSNLILESKANNSKLELNAPFNESNTTKMKEAYEFVRHLADNIYNFYEKQTDNKT